MPRPFANREEAGHHLARVLRTLGLERPLVLAVPRGGVAVADPVAEALRGELDVVVVRKIGAPMQPELGVGAVAAWGEPWLDERLVRLVGVTDDELARGVAEQRAEALRRVRAYRGTDDPVDVAGRDVVVVDDGIATGGTVIAAARLLRAGRPRRLILAVPVAPAEGVLRAEAVYDEVVALEVPEPFAAVGQWYVDFHQVSDDEVRGLLARASPGDRGPTAKRDQNR